MSLANSALLISSSALKNEVESNTPSLNLFDPICGLNTLDRHIKAGKKAGFQTIFIVSNTQQDKDLVEFNLKDSNSNTMNCLAENLFEILSTQNIEQVLILNKDIILDRHFFSFALDNCQNKNTTLFVNQHNDLNNPSLDAIGAYSISSKDLQDVENDEPFNAHTILAHLISDKKTSLTVEMHKKPNAWQNFTAENTQSKLEKELLHQQVKPTEAYVALKFNRPISLFVSKLLVNTPVTPNQITIFTLLLSFTMPYFLIQGTYWGYFWGAFINQAVSVLDGCDGELSRVKMIDSEFGAWLDTCVDYITHIIFFIGIGWGVYNTTGKIGALINAIVGTALFLSFLGLLFKEVKKNKTGNFRIVQNFNKKVNGKRSFINQISQFLSPLLRRANYTMIFFIMAIFNTLPWVPVIVTVSMFIAIPLLWITYLKKQPSA